MTYKLTSRYSHVLKFALFLLEDLIMLSNLFILGGYSGYFAQPAPMLPIHTGMDWPSSQQQQYGTSSDSSLIGGNGGWSGREADMTGSLLSNEADLTAFSASNSWPTSQTRSQQHRRAASAHSAHIRGGMRGSTNRNQHQTAPSERPLCGDRKQQVVRGGGAHRGLSWKRRWGSGKNFPAAGNAAVTTSRFPLFCREVRAEP
jgi:hypothetical protein